MKPKSSLSKSDRAFIKSMEKLADDGRISAPQFMQIVLMVNLFVELNAEYQRAITEFLERSAAKRKKQNC